MKPIFLLLFLLFSHLNFSQWKNINPVPEGNHLNSTFFINDSIGWIAGSGGFISQTTDGGITWNQQITNISQTINSVFFRSQEIGWLCSKEGKILKTTNGGQNWLQLFTGTTENLNQIKFITDDSGIAVGDNGIILFTTNGGLSWNQNIFNNQYNLLSLDFGSQSNLYISGINKTSLTPVFIKSSDGGIIWNDYSSNFNFVMGGFNTVEFVNADTGYVGGGDFYTSIGYIFKTTDGGFSWQQQSLPLLREPVPNRSHNLLVEDDYYGIRSIYFTDSDNGVAVGGNGNGWRRVILQTTNGGNIWTLKYHGMEEYGLLSVFITSAGSGFATGFNGSIFRSFDRGQSWRQQFSGGVFYGGQENISKIYFNNSTIGWACGIRQSFGGMEDGYLLLKTTDNGLSWITNKYYYDIPVYPRDIMFFGSDSGWIATSDGLQYTTDGGSSWNVFNNIISISSVFFINNQTGWLVSDDDYSYKRKNNELYNLIAKSTDGGITWTQKSTEGGNSIYFADSNTGCVVGDNGSIRKTTDGGETWLTKNAGTTANLNSVKFFNVNLGAVCGNNGVVLITTDGGETWQNRPTGLTDQLQSIFFKDENTLWCVGNNGKILESNNLGVSWVYHNDVTSNNLSTVALNPDGNLYIGGNNGALFKYSDNITPTLPHFNKIWTGNPYLPMNIYITSASLDNIPLNSGDEIAVFSGQYCVGSVKLSDSIPSGGFISLIASADDPTTSIIDGFIPGDTILFRVWDSETQTETEYVDAVFIQGEGRFAIQGTSVVELNAREVIYQTIALSGGWNILSLYSEPLNKNMLTIFDSLIDSEVLIKVQDETGSALEKLPPPIGWINNIGNWLPTEGYYTKIQNNSSTTLVNTGFKINLPLNVSLSQGWNIISYPFNSEQNAVAILQDLISAGHLIKVQDEEGNAIEYLPPPIGWINNIGNFKPGEGYYIKVNTNTSLLYQPAVLKDNDSKKIEFAEKNKSLHFVPNWQGNPYMPMNIYLSGFTLPDNISLNAGDEVGIYDNEICVGEVQISENDILNGFVQIIVSADDPTTEQPDGFISGNPVSLRVWLSGNNQTINISSPQFITGTGSFEALGTAVIGFENIIPVELISFNAEISSKTVVLSWQTASEMNNSGFEVQRAYSDTKGNKKYKELKWDIIGFVNGRGNSSEINSYSFTDNVEYSSGNILYRLKQIDFDGNYKFSDIVEVEIVPDELILYQNYPNPFNPTTKIRFVIPASSLNPFSKGEGTLVSLKVYDILGDEVATLVDENKAPGVYKVEFDANNLSSGVYLYKLQANDFVEVKKMILMR